MRLPNRIHIVLCVYLSVVFIGYTQTLLRMYARIVQFVPADITNGYIMFAAIYSNDTADKNTHHRDMFGMNHIDRIPI